MQNIASDFLDNIKQKAKDEPYVDNIEIAKIKGTFDLAIVVTEVKTEIHKVENGVFYYKPVSKAVESSQTYLALKRYEPYIKELLPLKVNASKFKLVFKKVSENEYKFFTSEQNVNAYLNEQLPELRKALLNAKENPGDILNRNEVDPSQFVYEDLEFITLRKELGIREAADPVWIPAIQEIREPSYLNEILKEATKTKENRQHFVDKTKGFAKISSDTAMEISEFEKKIFSRIK